MERTFITALVLIATFSLHAVTRRALVIGIGDYPVESGWHKINGDKDIPLVEEMLLANGFSKSNITELKNEQATCAAIKQYMEALISCAQSGDCIYIHFSGHGQQITDLNGDEEDGFDEAWITYDAQFVFIKGKYEGQNHIIDDQINDYLHRIREKIGLEGKIIVVADACHSGSGSRAEIEEEYIVRGTKDAFVIPNVTAKENSVLCIPSYRIEWVFLSACKSYQSNYEYKGNGSLTYALYQQRANLSKFSSKQIRLKVSACISTIIPFIQTPVLEVTSGAENDIFF